MTPPENTTMIKNQTELPAPIIQTPTADLPKMSPANTRDSAFFTLITFSAATCPASRPASPQRKQNE